MGEAMFLMSSNGFTLAVLGGLVALAIIVGVVRYHTSGSAPQGIELNKKPRFAEMDQARKELAEPNARITQRGERSQIR